MTTAIRIPHRMTVAEFQDWIPPAGISDWRWELVDGEPVCRSPSSENHGAIQSEVGRLLGNHLLATRPSCRVVTTPGVIPYIQSNTNERVPNLGVTCAPPRGGQAITDPVLLVEILSPSNEADRRRKVWAHCTIPSVFEVLVLSSTSMNAELLRRGPGGNWPAEPEIVGADDMLQLLSVEFHIVLRDFYSTTSLE